MKTKTIKRKNILSVLAVLVMLMAMLLTACGSSQAATPTPETETTEVENVKEEVTEPAESTEPEVAEEVVETEPTAEPTPEPEVEDSKYPGIDMESTLPGLEWLATLDEIVEEPLIVVYNDDTNKKVIVNEGDEVEFSRSSDVLALYTPNAETMLIIGLETGGGFKEEWEGDTELPDVITSKRRIKCERGALSSESEQKCTAVIMINGELKQYEFVLKFVD